MYRLVLLCAALDCVGVVADEVISAQVQELRRGTVVLACLTLLDEPQYGYALLETLKDAGVAVDGNTLYPLLRRLERQGLLDSEWRTDDSRPRKYYRVNPEGARVRDELVREWRALAASMSQLTREDHRARSRPATRTGRCR